MIVSPLPEGDLADQAAAYLRRLHGECFGDATSIRRDLSWLEANGFCSAELSLAPIQLASPQPEPPATGPWAGGLNGGFPPMGDGPVFLRVLTLLRHLLLQPFDQAGGVGLPEHLIERTEAIPGAYLPSEAATLRKDLEKLLTPYGFRQRNDLRNWLFGFGAGIRIDAPAALREEHRQKLETALAVHEQPEETHYNVMTARAEGHGARSGAAAAGLGRAAPTD